MSTKDFKDELSILQREPALITGVIAAIVGLLGAAGLQVDDNTSSALTAVVLAVLALVSALVIRTKVTPTAVANKAVGKAAADGAKAGSVVAEPVPVTPDDTVSVETPAPQPDVSYDPTATVPEEDGNPLPDESADVVDSTVESVPLDQALQTLEEATEAKVRALTQTAKSLETVQAEASTAASTYASKIAEAQQKLSEAQTK